MILPEKQSLRERAMELLKPYLKELMALGIYGSYARNEQTGESDIDILAITKDKELKIDLKKENIEVTSLPINKLKKAIQKQPVMYYQMAREAEPIINADIFDELKGIKPDKESFRPYLKEAKEHLRSNKELLELDKMDGNHLESHSVLYSSMLRLRGLFIIRCILDKDELSNKKFKSWMAGKGLSEEEFDNSYRAYRNVRDGKETKGLKIKINAAEKVLSIFEAELRSLEAQIGK